MPADLVKSGPAVVAPDTRGADIGEAPDLATKCGRCRQTFVRHPSIDPSDSPTWWLCPQCRSRLLGDVSKTDARWNRSSGGCGPHPTHRATNVEAKKDMDAGDRISRIEDAIVDLAVVASGGRVSHLSAANISSEVVQAGHRLQLFHQAVTDERAT